MREMEKIKLSPDCLTGRGLNMDLVSAIRCEFGDEVAQRALETNLLDRINGTIGEWLDENVEWEAA